MDNKVTYHQQVSYCGKPRCRKCRDGTGHGPYWYAYQTVDGRTTRKYIGKQLPPNVQAELDGGRETPAAQVDERAQAQIRIYALGQFRLERRASRNSTEWQTVTESAWQHQRVRALLACLISSPGRRQGREQIMEALWPDQDFETASGRLDRAVYSLRQLFEPTRTRLAGSTLLLTEREMIVLADQPQIWTDADAFEHLLNLAHSTQDSGEKEKLLDEAAMLYSGDLLPEERKLEWALGRRESLLRNWIGMLLDLADLRSSRQSYISAIEPLDRLLSVDPTNEAGVQRLIGLLAQLGRRGEALRAYKRLATVLQQEYNIAPLPETRALYEAVRRGVDKGQRSALPTPQSPEQAAANAARQDIAPVIQIGRAHQSPLVGRDQEVDLLHQLITMTENTARFKLAVQKRMFAAALDPQRRPQSVFLLGEVGIGKTRLAEEASRDAKKRGWAVAWSRVYAQENSIPYRLWIEVLRKAMAQGAWQRQELSNRPLVFQPLNALMPDLHISQVSFAASLSPEQEQLRLWEAVSELLAVISTATPLLIALDDLQWADGSSCELLAYLARRLHGHPIVIVGTCRENELARDHALRSLMPDLQRENALETISLQPLSDEQIDAIVANVPDLPPTLAEDIRQRAAGNPFFAEELARTFGTQPGSSATPGGANYQPVVLPDTITAVLDLRLGRLSPLCQALLRKASVLGSAFGFDLITAMDATTPGSNEDVVLDLLEEALKSGMLTEEGTGTRITYHFWHPLLASHLYEGLYATRRAGLHRRAATILIQTYQGREAEGAATITHHLVQGGADPQQIIHYAELAGNHAYSLSSYPEAEKHYRIALEYLSPDPIRLHADGRLSDEQLRKTELLELLGECTRIQGKYEEARQLYEQALHLRQQQRIAKSSDEYQSEAQMQALLWCEIGWTWYDVGKNEQARQCYYHGEQVLQDAGVVAGPVWAYIRYRQGYVSWREANYSEANVVAHEALKLFEEAFSALENNRESITRSAFIRGILAGDPISLGRTHVLLGAIAIAAGESTEGLSQYNTALTLYEQYAIQREIAVVCCDLGDVHLRRAEYSFAQANLRRSLNLAEHVGEIPLVSFALGNLGILDLRSGRLADSEAEFTRSIDTVESINDPITTSLWYTYLGITLLEQGEFERAIPALFRALSISRAMHVMPYIGLALVAIGELRIAQALIADLEKGHKEDFRESVTLNLNRARKTLQHALALEEMEAETRTEGRIALAQVMLLLGDTATAQQLAQQALEEARQFELTWLIARAQRVLGSIYVAQGANEQAQPYFDQALRAFRKTGMRLEHARTLQQYGEMLSGQEHSDQKAYQRGLGYLREAQEMFGQCKAMLDVRLVERVLAKHEQVSRV